MQGPSFEKFRIKDELQRLILRLYYQCEMLTGIRMGDEGDETLIDESSDQEGEEVDVDAGGADVAMAQNLSTHVPADASTAESPLTSSAQGEATANISRQPRSGPRPRPVAPRP